MTKQQALCITLFAAATSMLGAQHYSSTVKRKNLSRKSKNTTSKLADTIDN